MLSQQNELTYEDLKSLLYSYASAENCYKLKNLLTKYQDKINSAENFGIEGEEGTLFGFGLISQSSTELLQILIDNYIEAVIKKQKTTLMQKAAERKLSGMLERQLEKSGIEFEELSDRFKQMLGPWLSHDKDKVDSDIDEEFAEMADFFDIDDQDSSESITVSRSSDESDDLYNINQDVDITGAAEITET